MIMRIGIDVRALSGGKNTGVEEYIRSLLPELFVLGSNHQFVLFFNSFSGHCPPELISWSYLPNVSLVKRSWPNKLLNGLFWFFGQPSVEYFTGPVDLFFFPNMNFFALKDKTPFIITFHDLSFEHFPHFFNRKRRIWHFLINPKKKALESKKIITVSAFTAYDLRKTYRLSKNKIEAIHLGLDQKFFSVERPVTQIKRKKLIKKYKLPKKPFFLFLGTIEPRKNLAFLIKVFNLFKLKTGSDRALVIAGSVGWSSTKVFDEYAKSPFKKDIFFIGSVEEADRPNLYALAEIFLFPSLFEGFGLPPLEAMATGVPVLASASSSMIEILGDKALLSNPYDVAEFTRALEKMLEDPLFRANLSVEGKKYTQKFTWRKTAEKTLEVFDSIEKMS